MRHTSIYIILCAGLALSAGACKTDGNDNNNQNENENQNNNNQAALTMADLAGSYQLTGFAIDLDDDGTPEQLSRTPMSFTMGTTPIDAMVRGYVSITATDATAGLMEVHIGMVANQTVVEGIDETMVVTIEPEAGNFLIHGGDNPQVFDFVVDGSELALTVDAMDPRNASELDGPQAIVVERAEFADNEITGTHAFESITMTMDATGTQTGTASALCGEVAPGSGQYGLVIGETTFTPEGRTFVNFHIDLYADDTCSATMMESMVIDATGFYDLDEANGTLATYLSMPQESESCFGDDVEHFGLIGPYGIAGSVLTWSVDDFAQLCPGGDGGRPVAIVLDLGT